MNLHRPHFGRIILAALAAAGSAASPAAHAAQVLQLNTVYQCQAPFSIVVRSCTGSQPSDSCAVQAFSGGQALPAGRSSYAQVMALLPRCHVQSAAEAHAQTQASGPGGFRVGDRVRILSNGWVEGTVVQIRGYTYVVRVPGGLDIPKLWPVEVRRIGKLTAEDHAAGQYDIHEHVQALFNGRWTAGEILGQQGEVYTVKLPGVVTSTAFGVEDTITTTAQNIRISEQAAGTQPHN